MLKPEKIRIMIADDHSVVRFGIAAIVSTRPDMKVVAQAGNGAEAVDLFRMHRPDVTLIDLRMPELGGADVIRMLRGEDPEARFIVLTTYEGEEDIHRALMAGASAYLLKGMSHEELLNALDVVYNGGRYFPQSVLYTLNGRRPDAQLTSREYEIVNLIVSGLSNKEIAQKLGITEGTVKWHVNLILGRMGVSDRTQVAIAAVKRGIVEM
jgi:DNA-binding NarL/FixJ family response regulator